MSAGSKPRKIAVPLLAAICCLAVVFAAYFLLRQQEKLKIPFLYSKSCVVLDAETGRSLYEKAPDERMAPASLTKLMPLLLFFEAAHRGELNYDGMIPVSENAAAIKASRAGLIAGESQTADTMLHCILLPSGSDAVIALGESLYGSERGLLDAMNGRAEELGLKDTAFVNCVGVDAEGHLTTARDVAFLSRELVTGFPEVLRYSAKEAFVLEHKDGTQSILRNTNQLLRVSGVNGLKTGHTDMAGYCQSITYDSGKRKYIIVLMGAGTEQERGADAEAVIGALG